MSTHILLTLKSFFNFLHQTFPYDLMLQTMINVCRFIWFLVLSSFSHLFKNLVAGKHMEDDDHVRSVVFDDQEDGIFRSSNDSDCSVFDAYCGDEKSEFAFGFRFQMKEEDLVGATEVKVEETGLNNMTTSKYQFVSVQDFGGFVAEPKSGSFVVHELFVEPTFVEDEFIIKEKGKGKSFGEDDQKELNEYSNLSSCGKVDEFMESNVSLDQIGQMGDLSAIDSNMCEEKSKEVVTDDDSDCEEVHDDLNLVKNEVLKTEELVISEEKNNESVTDNSSCDEVQDELSLGKIGVLKTEEVNWLGEFFMSNDSFCYGFNSSHGTVSDSLDHIVHHDQESDDSDEGFLSTSHQEVGSLFDQESESFSPSVAEEIDDDWIEVEHSLQKEQYNSASKYQDESDLCLENTMEQVYERMVESELQSWEFDSDDDEEEDADILLEHQELIGQMKMELKNARTGGLPTILEDEFETPRMNNDYKPLKVNEKLEHRDLMAEIQKFYKSYTEKMHKLDVLNCQTLHAINFLRMKHPEQFNTGENESLSAIKSVLYPSLWPCKLRKVYADPTLKSVTELHKDLEIVYVGQACLSWEILHWQYKKAKELQLYDPQGYRSYNQVAIEFQQFHVLLKRFTEDELFQGPRVQNYTKHRDALRGLLQVPAIKDANLKEKKTMQKEGDTVSISTMANIIKESMTVFWEFLHTDKDITNLFLTMILQGNKAHLQDPADSDLFMEIKTIHQKKEKRLKDMLRTGNCIVKKFQKQEETLLDQHMFVSQVELRLVSRVLNLPRLTRDQLLWCLSKLNNIIFIDRKVQVEDSLFFIFPC